VAGFGELPNQALAHDLASALAMRAHPHGTIRTQRTAGNSATAVRHMVVALFRNGFTGAASDLTPAVLLRYWL
jgi:hypothetical protein